MALGGVPIGWNEGDPADTESVSLGNERIQSAKSSVRLALDSEHVFPAAGGTAGAHRPGSAMAFYGTQSAVSASVDGRVMLASDTSRFFGVGSGGTVLVGSPFNLSVGTTVGFTFPQRHYWAVEFGSILCIAGAQAVTIPNSGFSGVPYVVSTSSNQRIVWVDSVTPTSFQIHTDDSAGGALQGYATWVSIGTRVL